MPLLDLINIEQKLNEGSLPNESIGDDSISESLKKSSKKYRRKRNKIIRDSITSMALCNIVTPIKDEEAPTQVSYHGLFT